MSIVVGGLNNFNQILPNSKQEQITKPITQQFEFTDISFSVYYQHAVAIGQNNIPYGIGNNKNGRIHPSIKKPPLKWFSYPICNNNNIVLSVQSAVCGKYYTLHLLKEMTDDHCQLVVSYSLPKKQQKMIFLKSNDKQIVGIFGGMNNSAAIDESGCIHIITESYATANGSTIMTYLPESEMPTFVAFDCNFVIALSARGNVYRYNLESENHDYFEVVVELVGIPIVWISGTSNHSLVVSDDGCVFARGNNDSRQLGFKSNAESYTLVKALSNQKIVAAYAGLSHSLFQNVNGRIFATGGNQNGECLMANGNKEDVILNILPSVVLKDARYCIAGANLSMVFVGMDPPPLSPNLKLQVQLSYVKRFVARSKEEEENSINQLSKEIAKKIEKINSQRSELKTQRLKYEAKIQKFKEKFSMCIKENKELKRKLEQMEKQREEEKEKEKDDDDDYDEDEDNKKQIEKDDDDDYDEDEDNKKQIEKDDDNDYDEDEDNKKQIEKDEDSNDDDDENNNDDDDDQEEHEEEIIEDDRDDDYDENEEDTNKENDEVNN